MNPSLADFPIFWYHDVLFRTSTLKWNLMVMSIYFPIPGVEKTTYVHRTHHQKKTTSFGRPGCLRAVDFRWRNPSLKGVPSSCIVPATFKNQLYSGYLLGPNPLLKGKKHFPLRFVWFDEDWNTGRTNTWVKRIWHIIHEYIKFAVPVENLILYGLYDGLKLFAI